MELEDHYITKFEVAERLKVTTRTVEAWTARKWIPFLKVGRTVRFHWPTLLEALNVQPQTTEPAAKTVGAEANTRIKQFATALRQRSRKVEGN